MTFPNPWLYEPDNPATAVPQVFLVKTQRADGWVEVLLPVRPNGSRGWVHASDVTLTPNPYHIVVSLSAHTITVTNATRRHVHRSGRGGCAGHADADRAATTSTCCWSPPIRPGPTGPSPMASRATPTRSPPSPAATPRSASTATPTRRCSGPSVSHGCVRMDNDAITELSKVLPLGTPVDIAA